MREHVSNEAGTSASLAAGLPQLETATWTKADWAHFVADHASFRPDSSVYFVGNLEHAIKIGVSISMTPRLRELQCGSPVPLEVFATRPGGYDRESAYHMQFAAHRLHGEWFSPAPEILAEIDRINAEGLRHG